MKLTTVAIVAVDGFSPFHYSVPCILFGDTVSGKKRFNVTICAENPGLLTSREGFALNATQDYSAIRQADIVVVPYWAHVLNARRRRCSTAWCRPETTERKSSGCVWGHLFSDMQAFWMANGRRLTGNLNASSSRCSRR